MIARIKLGAIALACVLGLSACSPCSSMRDPMEAAAQYDQRPDGHGGVVYLLPLDTWTKNRGVERLLLAALQADGVAQLETKHDMQCTPRTSEAGCTDCFTCRRTLHDWGRDSSPTFECADYGTIRVQAEIGPGSSVSAMTYWQTTPAVHRRQIR